MSAAAPVRGVLVIDPDPAMGEAVGSALAPGTFAVQQVGSARSARVALRQSQPALIVLELDLPDWDGLLLCADICLRYTAPVLVCTGRVSPRDEILALQLGADDVVIKPVDQSALEARLRSVLRRSDATRSAPGRTEPPAVLEAGALRVNASAREAAVAGRQLRLTPTEFRLLVALAGRPNQPVTREELGRALWGAPPAGDSRALDVHVCRLRAKLAAGGPGAPHVASVSGVGYRLLVAEVDVNNHAA